MLIKIKTPFKFAHKGYQVVRYDMGTMDIKDERLIETILSEGWGEKVVARKKAKRK